MQSSTIAISLEWRIYWRILILNTKAMLAAKTWIADIGRLLRYYPLTHYMQCQGDICPLYSVALSKSHRSIFKSSWCHEFILPCQLNESKLNMTNWTEQLNKKPVKQKSTGQQQLNKKRFEQFVNWVKQFWQKSQLNIFLIEQKSNWTSNYWTSSQLNNMPTEHWTSENWSSFNWTFYNWT